MNGKVKRLIACAIVAIWASAIPAAAQTAATGNIEGVVTDPTGGVLPGVTVTVKNKDTNVAREAVTDGEGRYRAGAVQPGSYDVAAALSGFQTANAGNITVQVGQTAAVDVRMRPAGVTGNGQKASRAASGGGPSRGAR